MRPRTGAEHRNAETLDPVQGQAFDEGDSFERGPVGVRLVAGAAQLESARRAG